MNVGMSIRPAANSTPTFSVAIKMTGYLRGMVHRGSRQIRLMAKPCVPRLD
jgi:hypothetical protein